MVCVAACLRFLILQVRVLRIELQEAKANLVRVFFVLLFSHVILRVMLGNRATVNVYVCVMFVRWVFSLQNCAIALFAGTVHRRPSQASSRTCMSQCCHPSFLLLAPPYPPTLCFPTLPLSLYPLIPCFSWGLFLFLTLFCLA